MTIEERTQSRLACAYKWLEIAADDEPDEAGEAFQLFCRVYIKHLLHLSGVTSFTSDLDHCQQIKDALRGTYSVHQALAELREESGRPESPETISRAVGALVAFLATTSVEIAMTIQNIEQNHPELVGYFASERRMFDSWLHDEGPLAGTQWEFDHNKNYDH